MRAGGSERAARLTVATESIKENLNDEMVRAALEKVRARGVAEGADEIEMEGLRDGLCAQ